MKPLLIIFIFLLNFLISFSYDYKYEIMKNLEYFPIKEKNLWGLIDTAGNVVLKPKYHSVGICSEGLIPVRKNGFYGYITPKDSLIIKFQFDEADEFYNGIARVIYHGQPNLIDKTGNILFEHNYKDIKHYGFSNCFVGVIKDTKQYSSSDDYVFLDVKGNIINNSIYDRYNSFENGYFHLVKRFQDSTLKFILDSNGYEVDYNLVTNNLVYNKSNFYSEIVKNYEAKCLKFEDAVYLKNFYCFSKLQQLKIKNKLTYVNDNNQIIWQESNNDDCLSLNTEYKDVAIYRVKENNSKNIQELLINNIIEKSRLEHDFNRGLQLFIDSNVKINSKKSCYYNLYLLNNSVQDMNILSVDGLLYIILEAKDIYGNWIEIESTPSSFCGNSYIYKLLEYGKYYDFIMYKFEGDFSTKMRAKLSTNGFKMVNGKKVKENIVIYSNEIDASINRQQFWKNEMDSFEILDYFNILKY